MSALSDIHPTLLDLKLRMDPQGNVDKIIEILNQDNEIIDDAVFIEANQLTGHRTTVRTGIPRPTWRKLYGGVQPSKSRTAQVTESIGMLEAYAEVDKALADLNGNTAAFRMSEDLAFLEGMNQEFAETLFLGNEATEPEAFTGFAARFNDPSAENGSNILDGGGSGSDNTSIWLVNWGADKVHCIYPKGSSAGLQMRDLGEDTAENIDGSNGRAQIYRTHYRWDCGLTVRDWRHVVRIANIDVSDLTKNAQSGADLIDLMTQALEQIKSLNGRPAFYVNRTVRSFLRRQLVNKVSASTLSMDEVAGKKVLTFGGVPVRRVDALGNAETALSFA